MPQTASDSLAEARRKPLDKKAHRRPKFRLFTERDVAWILERVQSALDESSDVDGMVLESGRIELTGTESKVRFWSPQLTIDVFEEEGETLLDARFGPHPHIWTMYMALYSASLAFAIGCAMFGISQWMVGTDPWVLLLIPLSFLLSGLVYGATYVGQGLGALQMQELRLFVEKAISCSADDADA